MGGTGNGKKSPTDVEKSMSVVRPSKEEKEGDTIVNFPFIQSVVHWVLF